MNSSTSSSRKASSGKARSGETRSGSDGATAAPSTAAPSTAAPRLFLAAMAGGIVLAIAAASLADESYIHTGPEYGMSEALQDHVAAMCTAKAKPELLILGDSRAVAGVSVNAIRQAGINSEKFALGGAGIFAGWATLDRLLACGVRPRHVLLAYGTVNMADGGAIMDRTTNYDSVQGPRRSHEYDLLSQWEDRRGRKIAYKAVSLVGPELSLVDFVLMRPALKNVLEKPPQALANHAKAEDERRRFLASGGDRFYGLAEGDSGLPQESEFKGGPRPENSRSAQATMDLARGYGFDVMFYILPSSASAKAGVNPHYFAMAEAFRGEVAGMGVRMLNDIWFLPDADFGDPSHVNSLGREIVTADVLPKLKAALAADAGSLSAPQ